MQPGGRVVLRVWCMRGLTSVDKCASLLIMEAAIMTKYLIFAGTDYYPEGGFKDLLQTEANLQSLEDCKIVLTDAVREMTYCDWCWVHVVDLTLGHIVKELDLTSRTSYKQPEVEAIIGLLSKPW